MRAFAPLASLLLVALLLSGCAGGGGTHTDDPTASPSSTTSTSRGTGTTTTGRTTTATTTANPSGNHPPAGTVTASVPGGAVPLKVNFTLAGTDSDGDGLAWTLDADGDSQPDAQQAAPATMPGSASFTYTKTGSFNVTYTLTDGKASTTLHTTIKVTGTSQAATKQFTGHVVSPDPVFVGEGECFFALSNGFFGTPGGVGGDSFSLGGDFTGWAFAFDIDGMVAQFYNDAGYVGDAGATGTVAPDATGVYACSDSAANADYTLTLTSQ